MSTPQVKATAAIKVQDSGKPKPMNPNPASPGERLGRKLKGAFNAVKVARVLLSELGEHDEADSLTDVEGQLYVMKLRMEKYSKPKRTA